jgi:hypothetical protein
MLTIKNQKELILDRLCSAMNRANNTAKLYRRLKLFEQAKTYYHKASAYKISIALVKILEPEQNELTFENFPFIKNN